MPPPDPGRCLRKSLCKTRTSSARTCTHATFLLIMADESEVNKVPFTLALISGGVAGTAVDVALYPLDTLRTRMQVLLLAKHAATTE